MRPLWECDAHRVGEKSNELTVFVGVNVSTADQRRIRAAIEKETREKVARDIEARDPVEWALAGMNAGAEAAQIARGEA